MMLHGAVVRVSKGHEDPLRILVTISRAGAAGGGSAGPLGRRGRPAGRADRGPLGTAPPSLVTTVGPVSPRRRPARGRDDATGRGAAYLTPSCVGRRRMLGRTETRLPGTWPRGRRRRDGANGPGRRDPRGRQGRPSAPLAATAWPTEYSLSTPARWGRAARIRIPVVVKPAREGLHGCCFARDAVVARAVHGRRGNGRSAAAAALRAGWWRERVAHGRRPGRGGADRETVREGL